MIHSGQKNMSQPPKNHEMLKLYAFNSSLTNPKERCNSSVSAQLETSCKYPHSSAQPTQDQSSTRAAPKSAAASNARLPPRPGSGYQPQLRKRHLMLPLTQCSP